MVLATAKKAIWAGVLAAIGTTGGILASAFQDTDGLTAGEITAAITAGLVAAVTAGWKVYDVTNAPTVTSYKGP